MTRITLIAALGRNRVIGDRGQIPWRLPGELARFKTTTMGHTLVMGRKTFDSIGRALPGRRTVVITRNTQWHAPDVETAHSFTEALALAGPVEEVFVAGGGEIYAQALPMAHRLLLTEVDQSPEGDAFFPEWDPQLWTEVERDPQDGWSVVRYERAGGPGVQASASQTDSGNIN